MNARSHDLSKGPITKSLLVFAVPILLTNLLQQTYNTADSLILGRYAGSAALAAAGSVGVLLHLLIGFALGLATGVNILHALRFGAKDEDGMLKLVNNAVILSFIAAAALTILGLVFSNVLLNLMHIPEGVYGEAKSYLTIILIGTISTITYNVSAGVIRAEGNSLFPLLCLGISGILNLLLDLFFVAVLHWGIRGAAWATVIAQTLTAVLGLIRLARMGSPHALQFRKISYDRRTAADLVRISLPCGLQSSTFGISNFIIQSRVNLFGTTVMAAFAAYTKIDAFVYMPIFALSAAVSTFVGQNIGAGQVSRVQKGIRSCVVLGMGSSALLSACILFSIRPLLDLFGLSSDSVAAGVQIAWCMLPFVWFYPLCDILGGAVRGGGQSTPPTLISIICICLFRVVWLSIFRAVADVRFVYWCYPVSWWLSCFAIIWYYLRRSDVRRQILEAKHDYTQNDTV